MNARGKSDNKPGRKTIKWRGRKENRIEKQITKLSTEKTTISTENKLRCYQFPQRFVLK
jgi:hypothetical protein